MKYLSYFLIFILGIIFSCALEPISKTIDFYGLKKQYDEVPITMRRFINEVYIEQEDSIFIGYDYKVFERRMILYRKSK